MVYSFISGPIFHYVFKEDERNAKNSSLLKDYSDGVISKYNEKILVLQVVEYRKGFVIVSRPYQDVTSVKRLSLKLCLKI